MTRDASQPKPEDAFGGLATMRANLLTNLQKELQQSSPRWGVTVGELGGMLGPDAVEFTRALEQDQPVSLSGKRRTVMALMALLGLAVDRIFPVVNREQLHCWEGELEQLAREGKVGPVAAGGGEAGAVTIDRQIVLETFVRSRAIGRLCA